MNNINIGKQGTCQSFFMTTEDNKTTYIRIGKKRWLSFEDYFLVFLPKPVEAVETISALETIYQQWKEVK